MSLKGLKIMKSERLLNLEHALNIRELGGYQTTDGRFVKWHKLIRSGDISNLSKPEQAKLISYGLKYIIDLRSPDESEYKPDPVPDNVIYKLYPVYPTKINESSDLEELPLESHDFNSTYDPYLDMILSKHARKTFYNLFKVLLSNTENNKVVLFHCAAGKDRTGIASLLILASLGVPYKIIRDDYLLTNIVYSEYDQNKLRTQLNNHNISSFINDMNSRFNVLGYQLDTINKLIIKNFKNWNSFFESALNLKKSDLENLKKLYLT